MIRFEPIRDPVLWILIVLGCLFGFTALDWGTPNRERSLLVFGDVDRIRELSDCMVQARRELYAWTEDSDVDRPSATRIAEKPPTESFPPTAKAPPEEISIGMLNSMRSYLLRSSDPDEQQTLSGLANMNPLKGDFDPNEYRYGGCYYYTLAAVLGTAMATGLAQLRPGVEAYFLQPEALSTVFTFCRLLGALSAVLAGIILYLWSSRRWGRDIGAVATLFLYASPLVITYSRISKPNVYSMLLALLGLILWDRVLKGIEDDTKKTRRLALLSGVAFGLSVGSFVVSGIVLILGLLWALLRLRLNRRLFLGTLPYTAAGIVAGFVLTNPYVFLSWENFSDLYLEHASGSGWAYGVPQVAKLGAVLKDLPFAFGYIATVGLVIGFIVGIIQRTLFSVSCLVCFLLVGLLMGDSRFVIPLLPALFIVSGFGCRAALRSLRLPAARTSLVVVALLLVVGQGAKSIGTLAMDSEHRNRIGQWINETIPPGSTVGLPMQKPLIWHTPPMRFEKYFIHVFYTLDRETLEKQNPEWFVYQYENSESMREHLEHFPVSQETGYILVKEFERPNFLPGIPVSNPAYDFACQRVSVWRRSDVEGKNVTGPREGPADGDR